MALRPTPYGISHRPCQHQIGQQRLPDVQRGKRVFRFDGCCRPLLYYSAICLALPAFGVEIFDRLVIQQAVDRAGYGAGIEVVHFLTQLVAPIGNALGEDDIHDHHDERGRHQLPPEFKPEYRRYTDQFDYRRCDVEQQEIKHDVDALRTALDDLSDCTRPPVHVKPHRQIVQMGKDIFGQSSCRILPDPFEHDVSHIVEQHPAEPRTCIRGNQSNRDGRGGFHAP